MGFLRSGWEARPQGMQGQWALVTFVRLALGCLNPHRALCLTCCETPVHSFPSKLGSLLWPPSGMESWPSSHCSSGTGVLNSGLPQSLALVLFALAVFQVGSCPLCLGP
jgi:hypothetical protein